MAQSTGWGAVGYGIAGGFDRDRVQELDKAKINKGIDPNTNQPFAGTKEDLLNQEVMMLKQTLQDTQSQMIKSNEYDALADSVANGDFSSWNSLINTNPVMNDIYKNQQGIHKVYAPTEDTFEEYSIELDKAGLEPVSEYIKNQLANIDQQTGQPISDTVIVDGLEVPADTKENIQNIIKQVGVAFPMAEKADGTKELMSLEEHLATTGLMKSKFIQSQNELMLDAIAGAENSIQGITTTLVEANDKVAQAKGASADSYLAYVQEEIANNKIPMSQESWNKQGAEVDKADKLKQTKLQLEIQGLLNKNKEKVTQAFNSAEASKTSLISTIDLVDSLIKHPGREAATGMSFPLAYIPGTDAYDFDSAIETVKSNIFLDSIQQMKGFGALSNAEGQKLDTAIRSLNLGQKEETMVKNLNEIKDIFQTSLDRLNSGELLTPTRDTTTIYSKDVETKLSEAGFKKDDDGYYINPQTGKRLVPTKANNEN